MRCPWLPEAARAVTTGHRKGPTSYFLCASQATWPCGGKRAPGTAHHAATPVQHAPGVGHRVSVRLELQGGRAMEAGEAGGGEQHAPRPSARFAKAARGVRRRDTITHTGSATSRPGPRQGTTARHRALRQQPGQGSAPAKRLRRMDVVHRRCGAQQRPALRCLLTTRKQTAATQLDWGRQARPHGPGSTWAPPQRALPGCTYREGAPGHVLSSRP